MKCTNCGYEHNGEYCPVCGKNITTTCVNTVILEEKQEQQSQKKGISIFGCVIITVLIIIIVYGIYYYSDPYDIGVTGRMQYTILKSWKYVNVDNMFDLYNSKNGFMLVNYMDTRISESDPSEDDILLITGLMGVVAEKQIRDHLYADVEFENREEIKIDYYPATKYNVKINEMSGVGYVISFSDYTYTFLFVGDIWGMEKEIMASITQ